ncbi:FadR/GntR family transcriptional regulator [Bosea sp. (in: a-proteobacteria)]|uniref:FadR/GntR family transcriptional regulator n=1 Tax=Bosea sp. (in: a-proteobacteria) TaxID=1871050 RepID=UPI003B3BA868
MSNAGRGADAKLGRIMVPKSYEVLADRLRQTILDGALAEGARLPTERELVSQTGLSRGSVREALRKLEVEGLVKTKLGRLGGIIVSRPGNDAMAHFVTQFVRGRQLTLRTVQEARETLEPSLAQMAAERRTQADLEKMSNFHAELVDAIGDREQFAAINIDWHNAVAAASRNELLSAFLYSISYDVALSTISEEYDTEEVRQEVVKAHSRIFAAIEAGDGAAAFRRMQRHVAKTRFLTKAREDGDLPTD